MSPIPRPFRIAVPATLALALAGCLSVGDSPNITVYSPQVRPLVAADAPNVPWSLVVMAPQSSDALDSVRIAVRPQPGTLQVYRGAAFSDPVPDMLQRLLVEGFEDSGRIGAVGRQASGVRGDFALYLDIRHFEAVYADRSQPPAVVLEVHAKLMGNPSSRVLASRTFRIERAAAGEEVPELMPAFESALGEMVGEVVGWTLASGQQHAPAPAPARR